MNRHKLIELFEQLPVIRKEQQVSGNTLPSRFLQEIDGGKFTNELQGELGIQHPEVIGASKDLQLVWSLGSSDFNSLVRTFSESFSIGGVSVARPTRNIFGGNNALFSGEELREKVQFQDANIIMTNNDALSRNLKFELRATYPGIGSVCLGFWTINVPAGNTHRAHFAPRNSRQVDGHTLATGSTLPSNLGQNEFLSMYTVAEMDSLDLVLMDTDNSNTEWTFLVSFLTADQIRNTQQG